MTTEGKTTKPPLILRIITGIGSPLVKWLAKYLGEGLARAVHTAIIVGILALAGVAITDIVVDSNGGLSINTSGNEFTTAGNSFPIATVSGQTNNGSNSYTGSNSGSSVTNAYVCPYDSRSYLMYPNYYYTDDEFGSDHWMLYDSTGYWLQFGNSPNGYPNGYEGSSYDIAVASMDWYTWERVHAFGNVSNGAFWACKDSTGLYGLVAPKE